MYKNLIKVGASTYRRVTIHQLRSKIGVGRPLIAIVQIDVPQTTISPKHDFFGKRCLVFGVHGIINPGILEIPA